MQPNIRSTMNLYLRFILTLIFWRRRKRIQILDEAETPFIVLPSDLDPNLHMNNGIFLSIMDLGRIDYSFRSGMAKVMKKLGCYPVVASQTIRYQKSLLPFRKFRVKTKILGWDDRFVYVQQIFESKNEIVAFAIVKARFLSKNGPISPDKLVQEADTDIKNPILPSWVNDWNLSEEQFWKTLKLRS